jgi:hypothetical protein
MIANMIRLVLLLALWLATAQAFAVTGVNPTGVNVRSSGATTVFLTFQSLDADEDALESFWCGELIAPLPANQVFNFNPCNPATIFGRLPARLDRSTVSGTGGRRNLTDIMTIPASVTRRALQSAQAGQASQFFYVRRFSSGLFVVVTCRMSGGGARSPLALTEVRMGFLNDQRELLLDPIYPVAVGATLPPVGAYIKYTGAGRLKGRWEVALPGDPPPSEFDLFTEGTLPVEQRGLQRRYSILERFEIFLTPVGEAFIPGPRALEPPTQGAVCTASCCGSKPATTATAAPTPAAVWWLASAAWRASRCRRSATSSAAARGTRCRSCWLPATARPRRPSRWSSPGGRAPRALLPAGSDPTHRGNGARRRGQGRDRVLRRAALAGRPRRGTAALAGRGPGRRRPDAGRQRLAEFADCAMNPSRSGD